MKISSPHTGLVINYGYLWHRESITGAENGRKNRPCAVILVSSDDVTMVVPITHTEPEDMSAAVELPIKTAKRLGLDDKKSWIICSELNQFVWPGPDLGVISVSAGTYEYGTLPPKLVEIIIAKIQFIAQGRKLQVVKRV